MCGRSSRRGTNQPYRIRQVYKALTGSLVRDWKEATNLPRALQAALSEEAPAAALTLERVSLASDGTRKYLFYTRDSHAIETVMIPEKARRTVCISTQVGMPDGLHVLRHGAAWESRGT